ncbi:insulinase family protein [Candidatus Parcubacteria bacterium]|nr:insulinase family protein [Candidatus Parcubacteria bacterium]
MQETLKRHGIEYVKLKNGMTVILKQIKNPWVRICLSVRCGSIYEKKDNYGISHLLEHMAYSSAGIGRGDKRSKPTYKIEREGVIYEPETGPLYTSYPLALPHSGWRRNLKIFLSALKDLRFSEKDFESEKNVILREMNDGKDLLGAIAMQRLFPCHALGVPVDGKKSSLSAITSRRVKNWHRRFYSPERMTLVAVGDISLAQISKLVNMMGYNDLREPSRVIVEPLLVDFRWNCGGEITGIDSNAAILYFKLPLSPEDLYFYTFITKVFGDTSLISLTWESERDIGLYNASDYGDDINGICNYGCIELIAPSGKLLKKLERKNFSLINRIIKSGYGRDIFHRQYIQNLLKVEEGREVAKWWFDALNNAFLDGYFSALGIQVEPDKFGEKYFKAQVEGVFRLYFARSVVFRSFR